MIEQNTVLTPKVMAFIFIILGLIINIFSPANAVPYVLVAITYAILNLKE